MHHHEKHLTEVVRNGLVPALPFSGKDVVRRNAAKRGIIDLGRVTSANMLSLTSIRLNGPMIMCGTLAKNLPILRQLFNMAKLPFVLVFSELDGADSCLDYLPLNWIQMNPVERLPQGSGMLKLHPSANVILDLKECISEWTGHLVVLSLGTGLQVDNDMLNCLNSLGRYVILSNALNRSVRHMEGQKLTVEELLASMDYILVSSIGNAARVLLNVLPTYEAETFTRTLGINAHQSENRSFLHSFSHYGDGISVGQTSSIAIRPIVTQDELTWFQQEGKMFIYNAEKRKAYIAKITR